MQWIRNEEEFTTVMTVLFIVAALIVDGAYALSAAGRLVLP